ncbi:acyl-CoA dehydrogenase family protein [Quadrisphaera setariae]|uniref:glutaryl-CoA dehydrogenase (ETF) n=1 Tax=Quadrisphaera setariae TaxID=2593304 RepID=A0A5C8ZCD2_9ACTN|nr:acyl-CoA dehydrogenase family protein [Quadrisphaera setariae]TXR55094.1 acyl-CoA dehydrogenase [Quadrisphaera setariae]
MSSTLDRPTASAATTTPEVAAQAAKPPAEPRPHLLGLEGLLSDAEREVSRTVAAFVDAEVRPHVAEWFENAHFPREIMPRLGELGLLGMHLSEQGCPGRSAVEYGLAALELEAGDSGLRTAVSVQGSLAMSAIAKHGSAEQKAQWLPGMAAGRIIGCFGLTEPTAGSDPGSMKTHARRDGAGERADWVLTGAKRWIGLASIADVAVIWAATDEGVRGFLVPTDTPGFTATPIPAKLSMRASVQCDLAFDEVRLPADALLPGARGLSGPFSCLNEARYGISWGVLGAARDSYLEALRYSLERQQFGRPLAGYQLTQKKLADMAVGIEKGWLLALHLGRLKDAGSLAPHQISVGKLDNTRTAIEICREARTVLGGNGITLDHAALRHANNLESVRTYEGTDEVHTLVIGQRITGIPAFR